MFSRFPKSSRRVRAAAGVALTVALLGACSSGDSNGVPRGWIRDTYTANGPAWVDRDSNPVVVADAIHGHRAALDRANGDSSEFLRYGDDLVTVSPYGAGSRIAIEDYRNGYHRHSQYLGGWPDPDSASFRGGGPGEGK